MLALDKDEAQEHLSKARTHLLNLLNAEEPPSRTVDLTPVIDPEDLKGMS
jgi:hypothetical protein